MGDIGVGLNVQISSALKWPDVQVLVLQKLVVCCYTSLPLVAVEMLEEKVVVVWQHKVEMENLVASVVVASVVGGSALEEQLVFFPDFSAYWGADLRQFYPADKMMNAKNHRY